MGNCQNCCGKSLRKVTILIVGLDNAGKTTAAKVVQKLPINSVAPTVGYSSDEFTFGKHEVILIDVGGGKRIRDIWKNYFAEIHGTIYVVDSSDLERLEESKTELTQLLSNPLVSGKPVLLLANKQDKPGALDEVDIEEKLNLEAIVNQYKCLCKVEMCAAVRNQKDKAVKNGLAWLLSVIDEDYENLNSRISTDVKQRDIEMEQEMAARRERVRVRREERAAQEAEEEAMNLANGDHQADSNPATNDNNPSMPPSPSLRPPAESPSKVRKSGLGDELLDDDDDDESVQLPGAIPASSAGIARPVSNESTSMRQTSTPITSRNSSPSVLVRTDQAVTFIAHANGVSRTAGGENDQQRPTPEHPSSEASWTPSSTPQPDDIDSMKTKKKRKKANRVAPGGDAIIASGSILPPKKLAPLRNPNSSFEDLKSNGTESNFGHMKLPPLFAKPNAHEDDDIIV